MALFDDVMLVENEMYAPDPSPEYYDALQRLVDNGTVWSLQGMFGRAARAAIASGHVRPAGAGHETVIGDGPA